MLTHYSRSFITQVPLTFAGFLLVYYVLEAPKKIHSIGIQRLRKVDFGGAISLILAVSTLLVGLHEGANVAWNSPAALGCLCASGPLFAFFLFIEFRIASEPIAPKHVLTDRTLLACALCNFFALGTWFGLTYYLPLYWQAVERLDATQAAVLLMPGIVANVVGSLFAGTLMKQTGKYYWLTVICYTTLTLGVVPIILFTGVISHSIWGILAGTTLSGFSNGIGNTSSLIALIAHADRKDQAVAISTLYLFRSLGSVVGISLTAAVIQQSLRTQIQYAFHGTGNVDAIAHHIKESLGYLDTLQPEMQNIIRSCYEHATRWGFVLDLVFVLGAVGASLFIRERSLLK